MSTNIPEKDARLSVDADEVSRILKEEEMKRNEPMLSRYSHAFGLVECFAPFAPVESWKDLPWTLKVQRFDDASPRRFRIKPDKVMKAYMSPGLIESHKYEFIGDETILGDTPEQ